MDLPSSILYLFVVDWEGEEKARMQVRPSDTVLVGMQQIEDQIGVHPRMQRLVCLEEQLLSKMLWSDCKSVRDGSNIQLTVVTKEDAAAANNMFDSLVLEQPQVYDCGHIHTRNTPKTKIICGTQGIALTPYSGQRGYFEAMVTRIWLRDHMWIGVSTFLSDRSLALGERLVVGFEDSQVVEDGGLDGSIMWAENGRFVTSLFGVPRSMRRADASFYKGDSVGIMICCMAKPTISFCRNGVVVHKIVPSEPDCLLQLYPAFPISAVTANALSLTPSPTIPPIFLDGSEEEEEEEDRR